MMTLHICIRHAYTYTYIFMQGFFIYKHKPQTRVANPFIIRSKPAIIYNDMVQNTVSYVLQTWQANC